MPTIYFPVSHNCWGHSQPQPAGLLQDACDPGRDFRPWGNTKIQLTQQNKHSLKYSDRVCTCPVEQAGARQKKSSHEIHQFSTSSQSFPMSFKYRFYLPSWCLAEPCRDHQPSHCRVFSSRTSMSVFLKTTPSVPTPGYFTSFRISVDSTQMQVKTGTGSWHVYMDHDGRKSTSWHYSGTFCVPSLPAFWKSVHIYC